MKYFFAGLLTILFSINVFAQNTKTPPLPAKELQKLESAGADNFSKDRYHLALPIYKKLDSLYPKNPKYIYPLGLCYLYDNQPEKSMPYLEACLKKYNQYPSALFYHAAHSYHLNHKPDDAIRNFERYKAFVKKSGDKRAPVLIANLDRQIRMCKYGKQLMMHPVEIEVFNLGPKINSQYPDYKPVLSVDEKTIIFTSCRPSTTGGQRDQETGVFFEDMYYSYKTDSGWTAALPMGENINTAGHDASISLTPEGDKLILYRYGKEKMISTASGDLYISELNGGKWTKAIRLPENINSEGWEPSACLAEDSKVLYFASSRPGGFGGTDIYVVRQLPNGTWALPKNLGSKINTPYDEDAPFIHPNGKKLYFSSNGHNTMGGYDIFVSDFKDETNEWSDPENVGYPINTANDDINFTWSADGRRVYFSSIRNDGYGDKDIYYAIIHKKETETLILKGNVLNAVNKAPIDATIKITDKSNNEVVGIFNSDKSNGEYLVILDVGKTYSMTIESPSYEVYNEDLNLSFMEDYKEMEKNILMKPR